jgi:hypothetical protein
MLHAQGMVAHGWRDCVYHSVEATSPISWWVVSGGEPTHGMRTPHGRAHG